MEPENPPDVHDSSRDRLESTGDRPTNGLREPAPVWVSDGPVTQPAAEPQSTGWHLRPHHPQPSPPVGPVMLGGVVDDSAASSSGGTRRERLSVAALGALVGVLVGSLLTAGLLLAFRSRDADGSGVGVNVAEVLSRVGPAVVSIQVGEQSGVDVFGGSGSGVAISSDGLVLTNAHVVNGARNIEVGFSDGSQTRAELVGSFPDRDVAVVKLTGAKMLPAIAKLGHSSDLGVGDPVVAIGNALNLGATPTVTEGIVSALNRQIVSPINKLSGLIQTDAAINPGNSGGALVNEDGEVVGIVTAMAAEGQGVGFALAIDEIVPLIDRIRSGDATITKDSAFLGVSTVDADEGSGTTVGGNEGALVESVLPDSAAEEAGVEVGDVIVAVDGSEVTSSAELGELIRAHKSGEKVRLKVIRGTKEDSLEATLGKTGG